jgi:uncharacterized protein (TIGR02145 family)
LLIEPNIFQLLKVVKDMKIPLIQNLIFKQITMKKRKPFIQLLLIAGLLFAVATACDKTDDPGGEDPNGDSPNAETVNDADGNKYNTVKIGTQVWTVENLKTTRYNDGTPIPNVTDNYQWSNLSTGAYCNYDNLESNAATYGRLYNWYAVNTGKLAPAGWHVPTDNDWTILEKYLIANGYNYDGTKDVDKIAKSLCAKTNWALSNLAGTPGAVPENNNSSGFTALPCGYRYIGNGTFDYVGKVGYWWSSTELYEDYDYSRCLHFSTKDLLKYYNYDKGYGFSVRLVRD